MKKFFSILMIFAVVLACCACAEQEVSQQTTEPAETTAPVDMSTPEAQFGHIDQTQPLGGVYKLWNPDGVKFMMENHPDGEFEILCNIDMGGATLAPIPEFTGTIKGGNFTLSNFVLQGGSEESFGFIAHNKGTLRSLLLKDVTFIPGENAKNIGSIAGINDGMINACEVTGTLAVTQAAPDAACGAIAGVNTGTVMNTIVTVDNTYSAPGAAHVGGLVGIAQGGKVEFSESHGVLTVTGEDKTTGLFAGNATDMTFLGCVFGGADNSLNGELFLNFTGNPDDDELVVADAGLWRDNACVEKLPDNVMALRNKVVDAMYRQCTVQWRVEQDLTHSCTCQLSTCHGVYSTEYTYVGMPYNHKAASVKRFNYALDEDGTLADWVYDLGAFDGFDVYIGTDCSGAVQTAWWSVSNSTNIRATDQIMPAYGNGTIAVGDYKCDFKMTKQTRDGVTTLFTAEYLEANTDQAIYEAYADTHPGDGIINRVAAGGHTRMIASEPVVIRDQAGQINPTYSYVICHEQGGYMVDDVNKVCTFGKHDWKYTFAALYDTAYLPFTCEELITGEMEPVEAKLEGGCNGYAGMFNGTVQANYHLDAVTLTILDGEGNTVLDHPMFVTAQKYNDYGNNYYTSRNFTNSYDMSNFAMVMTQVPLEQGKTYSYTVTANLATFDNIVVHEGEFSYG